MSHKHCPSWFFLFCCPLVLGASGSVGQFSKPVYKHSLISICLQEAGTHKTIASQNEQQAVMPASVIKLVTTATALELLGPDYCFETRLEYTGAINGGRLDGNLIIRGGGDPTLGSRHLGERKDTFIEDWIQMVKQAGINVIAGDVLADASLFDDEPISPFWLWEDIGNYYAAGAYGLGVYDNSFTLNLQSGAPGSQPTILSVIPELPELVLENHLKAAGNTKDSAYFYGMPYQWRRSLYGTIPANQTVFSIRGDIPDPPLYTAGLLRKALSEAGILVEGEACDIHQQTTFPNTSSTLLGTTRSIPLWQIIRIIHEKSDNVYTEYLLRHIARTAYSEPASARNGLNVIKAFWANKGLDVTGLFMTDGCGLSPLNRVSAAFIASVLDYMATQSQYASQFECSLPLAGVQGTVSSFLKDTPLAGKVRLKSGSNQTTTAYAGYYQKKGATWVVVMLVNHTDVSRFQVRKDMEDFLLTR